MQGFFDLSERNIFALKLNYFLGIIQAKNLYKSSSMEEMCEKRASFLKFQSSFHMEIRPDR